VRKAAKDAKESKETRKKSFKSFGVKPESLFLNFFAYFAALCALFAKRFEVLSASIFLYPLGSLLGPVKWPFDVKCKVFFLTGIKTDNGG